jgi:hypothetical protein
MREIAKDMSWPIVAGYDAYIHSMRAATQPQRASKKIACFVSRLFKCNMDIMILLDLERNVHVEKAHVAFKAGRRSKSASDLPKKSPELDAVGEQLCFLFGKKRDHGY